jgi:phosphohistidine phosphatase
MTAEPRRLVLIRHAKAAQDVGPDTERPLTPRGLRDARAIGRWLAAKGPTVDQAVVSPARRTRQTWESLAAELRPAPGPIMDERVYTNTVERLLEVIRGADSDAMTLAIVGHNPSIHALAVLLDNHAGEPGLRTLLRERYPTSAVSVFECAFGWKRIRPSTAELVAFEVPRG